MKTSLIFPKTNISVRRLFLIPSFVLFTAIQSFGQTIKVDAEIRSRVEYRDGFQEPLADTLKPAYINNLRTKLNFAYSASDRKSVV